MDKTDPRWRNSETVPGCYIFLGVVRRIQAKQKEKKWTEKFWRKGKKSTLLRKYEVKVR